MNINNKELLDFSNQDEDLSMFKLISREKKEIEKSNDIAIIGMAGQIGGTNDLEEFWDRILKGEDLISELPKGRKKDADKCFQDLYLDEELYTDREYIEAAYLKEIDKFDYKFFNILPREAEVMDPSQRMLLETAIKAIEDAGYGGKVLRGTQTGVYVGNSTANSDSYHQVIKKRAPELLDVGIPGNLNSVLSSRISYFLDLKGPSLVIDTACSSSLVALHIACKDILNGNCNMAIVGSVEINILPPLRQLKEGVGICSLNGRTHTFDETANGTGVGEGVVSIVIKQLDKALEDGDNIQAIIKGSAVNQDGKSVAITAPNAEAQKKVLTSAWKDAKISPLTIQYIEAHGTATKLGDVVEIEAINQAFEKYTTAKQFCAIGSIKTNVGHTNSTSGLAGVIKGILCLKKKKLLKNLHFNTPNSKIDFINSPVYICDRVIDWETENQTRRCGVSSFGLSGTNAHVVLEEAEINYDDSLEAESNILVISAQYEESLKELASNYLNSIEACNENDIPNFCYTAQVGRGHYGHRIAVIFENKENLIKTLNEIVNEFKFNQVNSFYGVHQVVDISRKNENEIYITSNELSHYNLKANGVLESYCKSKDSEKEKELCKLYVKGANIDWQRLYQEKSGYRRISIPSYPFKKNRCWVEKKVTSYEVRNTLISKKIVSSLDVDIYELIINTDRQWEIGEHVVGDSYLLVGTAYLEMIAQLAKKYYRIDKIQIKDIILEKGLFAPKSFDIPLQIFVKQQDGDFFFKIMSKNENESVQTHCKGKFTHNTLTTNDNIYNVEKLKLKCNTKNTITPETYFYGHVKTSDRWRNTKTVYIGENLALAYIEVSEKYKEEYKKYQIYPSILDAACNFANGLAGDGVFLPWSYGSIEIFEEMPTKIYSYIEMADGLKGQEIGKFNIVLLDEAGKLVAKVSDYIIKKVDVNAIVPQQEMLDMHHIVWKESKILESKDYEIKENKKILILKKENCKLFKEFKREVNISNCIVATINPESKAALLIENEYVLDGTQKSYQMLVENLGDKIDKVIYLNGISDCAEMMQDDYMITNKEVVIDGFFYLMKAISKGKVNNQLKIVLLGNNTFDVTGKEKHINCLSGSLAAMIKSLKFEYPNYQFKYIDYDDTVDLKNIILEIDRSYKDIIVALRHQTRYIEMINKISQRDLEKTGVEIKRNFTYLITGGLGGVGLSIARALTMKEKVNIILIGRSKLDWPNVKNERISEQIEEIKRNGSNISYYHADVSNYSRMKKVIDSAEKKYGKINGVIHCAGVASGEFLFSKSKDSFDKVLNPKTLGVLILNKLLKGQNLDFFIVCSSITSIFGSAGQSDYAAGNLFLNQYCIAKNKLGGSNYISINWPTWAESGMAVRYGFKTEESLFLPISNDEGINAFNNIINLNMPNILIGKLNYDLIARTKDKLNVKFVDEFEIKKYYETDSKVEEKKDITKEISNNYHDITSIEKALLKIWTRVLGVEDISIYDKFFESNGNSLLATYLLREVNQEFGDILDITDIFVSSSIELMAQVILERINDRKNKNNSKERWLDEDDMDRLLEELAAGNLSVEDLTDIV